MYTLVSRTEAVKLLTHLSSIPEAWLPSALSFQLSAPLAGLPHPRLTHQKLKSTGLFSLPRPYPLTWHFWGLKLGLQNLRLTNLRVTNSELVEVSGSSSRVSTSEARSSSPETEAGSKILNLWERREVRYNVVTRLEGLLSQAWLHHIQMHTHRDTQTHTHTPLEMWCLFMNTPYMFK